jgi:hypothetical protein
MPIDSILVSVGVMSVFVIFAAVLACVDHHTSTVEKPTLTVRKRRAF